MYPETTLNFELDGCGPDDDIDLDVPELPHLESAAEVDFSSCAQGAIYAFGKNGAVISGAAPPDADHEECTQAVEEEPAQNEYTVELESGSVVCVVHYGEKEGMRVFRLAAKQVSGWAPTSIVLTAVGWK